MTFLFGNNAPARVNTGRGPARKHRTSADIEREAIAQLKSLSTAQMILIDALASGGVLTAGQLRRLSGLRLSTLRTNLQAATIVDPVRLPDLSPERVVEMGLAESAKEAAVFTLGELGLRIAELRHAPHKPVQGGYVGCNGARIIHDLCVNEIVLSLSQRAVEAGWQAEWIDKNRAAVGDEKGTPILEPDAVLLLRFGGTERMFAIEYHNEDRGNRAKMKIGKYMAAFRAGRWRETWETEAFPVLTAVFRHAFVGNQYVEAVKKAGAELKFRVVGKTWTDFRASPAANWIAFKKMTYFFPLKLPSSGAAANGESSRHAVAATQESE